MAQKKIKATVSVNEMLDGEATFISLVGAGANRAAYKVLKDEKGGKPVLDFSQMFKEKLDADAEGIGERAILAVLVDKSADLEKAKVILKDAGFDVDTQVEAEGAYVFMQQDDANLTGDRAAVYKANDTFGAVVELEKAFQPFPGSSSFTENLNSQGFFPSLALAQSVFTETAHTAMIEAEDRDAAVASLRNAGEEFSAHITQITQNLPEAVFKLDGLEVEKVASFQDPNAESRAKEPSPNDPNASGREDPAAGEAKPPQGPNAVAKAGDEDEEKEGKGKPFGGKKAKPFGKKKVDAVAVANERGIDLSTIERVEVHQDGLLFVAKVDAGGGSGGGVNIFVRFDTMDGMPPSPEVGSVDPTQSEGEALRSATDKGEKPAGEAEELTGAEMQARADAGIFGEQLEAALTPVTKALEALTASTAAAQASADEAVRVAKGAAEAAGGTVLAEALGDLVVTDKGDEGENWGPLMDTGMDAEARSYQLGTN